MKNPEKEIKAASIEKVEEVIDSNLLLISGGAFKKYNRDEYIFREGQHPHFYHQVIEGKVKMISEAEEGRAFIQGFFKSGQSFGEPPIFGDFEYPASAVALEPTVIIRLNIPAFFQLLQENYSAHLSLTRILSLRLSAKADSLKEISCHPPEHRILSILNHFKQEARNGNEGTEKIKIQLTRREIADMTGLRVETVIRAMKILNEKSIVTIEKGKVYL